MPEGDSKSADPCCLGVRPSQHHLIYSIPEEYEIALMGPAGRHITEAL
jgi:hypothetical protein